MALNPTVAAGTIARWQSNATEALNVAEQSINAVALRGSSGKDGKAAVTKIISGARQVLPIMRAVSELHPIAKVVVGTFGALVEMEAARQNTNLQIAVVYHSMTITMHAFCQLEDLLDLMDSAELQTTLNELVLTMREFGAFSDAVLWVPLTFALRAPSGNLANTYYRYSAKHAIWRLFRSAEYKEQLHDINDRFMRLRGGVELILRARASVVTFRTYGQVQTIAYNIDTVIEMLGAINAREEKALTYSNSFGGPDSVIQDDILLFKVAEILGEKLPPQIKAALRKDMEDILKQDRTQFDFALHAARDHIEEGVARSEMAIIRHLDAGPHELIYDRDIKTLWQDHPAIGNAIDEDGSGFISVHELNHFVESRPVSSWTVPETLVFWAVVWPQSNVFYHRDVVHCLRRIRMLINQRFKQITDIFEDYLAVLKHIDIVVESFSDDSDEDGSDGLLALREAYIDVKDRAILKFLEDTDYRISDVSTLEYIAGQRIELILAPLLGQILTRHMEIIEVVPVKELDDEKVGPMYETCASIFDAFYERFQDLKKGWKQQKVDVRLYMESFANGLFTAIYNADQSGFNELEEEVDEFGDEFEDEDEENDTLDEVAAVADNTTRLLQMVSDMSIKMAAMEARQVNMEMMLVNAGLQDPTRARNIFDRSPATEDPGMFLSMLGQGVNVSTDEVYPPGKPAIHSEGRGILHPGHPRRQIHDRDEGAYPPRQPDRPNNERRRTVYHPGNTTTRHDGPDIGHHVLAHEEELYESDGETYNGDNVQDASHQRY
ncbi:hypothetical protein EYR38_008661 [Pleurotus pulmonarius]|nr:hypothetical protein EYR38_008661 [Pleurotus pulmonarius]